MGGWYGKLTQPAIDNLTAASSWERRHKHSSVILLAFAGNTNLRCTILNVSEVDWVQFHSVWKNTHDHAER